MRAPGYTSALLLPFVEKNITPDGHTATALLEAA